MAHLAGKDIYHDLGRKIDNMPVRAPWSEAFYNILREIYTPEEADLVTKMPYGLSDLDRVAEVTKYEKTDLKKLLDSLTSKGLVMDMWVNDAFHYMPSPIVIGIFEFTMMRTGPHVDSKKLAGLFHDYLQGNDGEFYRANATHGEKVSVIRALPHEEAVKPEAYVEVLDYESAKGIVEDNDKYAIGICSCRHEKEHMGEKECDIPLEKCSSFGGAADFLIRNNLAREVSKTEMLENIEHSKENSLVLNADNVQKNVTFICHCCSCCCNALLGVSKFGYPGIVVTSNFIAEMDPRNCVGCGQCADACPVNAITMVPVTDPSVKRKKEPRLDASLCLGCGVCALNCETGGMGLVTRAQRVLHPETTFERIILQSLERGNLQNQLFDNPQSIGQKFMRGFVGGFLRLSPVKKALTSDALRSRFLDAMKSGVERQGKGWLLEM